MLNFGDGVFKLHAGLMGCVFSMVLAMMQAFDRAGSHVSELLLIVSPTEVPLEEFLTAVAWLLSIHVSA